MQACSFNTGIPAFTTDVVVADDRIIEDADIGIRIDIADIDIGENIGAKLQTDQAEADLKVANARAEERRAMAVASEQEMRAKAQEARAKVIEAEAQLPLAMADAFRSGNLGIMDYYKIQNLKSDTEMRDSIAKPGSGKGKQP